MSQAGGESGGEAGFELLSRRSGALPLINHFLDRIGLDEILSRWLPEPDRRFKLTPAAAIRLLVVNLLVGRAPLYGLAEWAAGYAPELLGLPGPDLLWLNDDRVGRALVTLFDADRASLLTELIVGVVDEFGVDTAEMHNDSTSVSVHGAYEGADGTPRRGKPTPAVTFGHSKDHRPDLKQLVWILTVSADGSVPMAYRLEAGPARRRHPLPAHHPHPAHHRLDHPRRPDRPRRRRRRLLPADHQRPADHRPAGARRLPVPAQPGTPPPPAQIVQNADPIWLRDPPASKRSSAASSWPCSSAHSSKDRSPPQ